MAEEEKSLQEELSIPVQLASRVRESAAEAESSKQDCSEIGRQVEGIAEMLRSVVRLAAANPALYDRPVRRIAVDAAKNLERALTLVRKCKHSGVLRQVFVIASSADFRKVSNLLECSIGDLRWLLNAFDSDGGADISLPPIGRDDPILAWVWSHIATLHVAELRHRVESANSLAILALDNDRNKKMITDEGGIAPLLKLLNEFSSEEAQMAAATALHNLCTGASHADRVRSIVAENGVPVMVRALSESPAKVQILVAELVARMAELDFAQNEFADETATRPLITTLAMNTVFDDPKPISGKTSIHSIVLNKELAAKIPNHLNSPHSHKDGSGNSSSHGSSRGGQSRKDRERELETPEMKLKVKTSCAKALCHLAKGNLLHSRKITEPRGLLCLAKLIEMEEGELQLNCLLTVMEVAVVAESNPDLRRSNLKISAAAVKAVLDQLLRVIQDETSPALQIPAIKSVGCLARTFPAKESRIIGPLVARLNHGSADVGKEAAIALGKFVCQENFNHTEHSKAIVENDGVQSLMRMIKTGDLARISGLELLCHLALNVGNNKVFEKVRALNVLEKEARSVVAQNPDMKDLFAKAIHHLTLYQPGAHSHGQSYAQ